MRKILDIASTVINIALWSNLKPRPQEVQIDVFDIMGIFKCPTSCSLHIQLFDVCHDQRKALQNSLVHNGSLQNVHNPFPQNIRSMKFLFYKHDFYQTSHTASYCLLTVATTRYFLEHEIRHLEASSSVMSVIIHRKIKNNILIFWDLCGFVL